VASLARYVNIYSACTSARYIVSCAR